MRGIGDDEDDIASTWVSAAADEVQKRVFQLVFVLGRADARLSDVRTLAVLGRVVVFLQLLSLPFAPELKFAWNSSYVTWLQDISTAFRLDRAVVGFELEGAVPIWLTALCLALVGAWLGAGVWLSVQLNRHDDEIHAARVYNSQLIAYRRVSELLAGVLYIPVMGALLTTLRCGDLFDRTCGSASHVLLAAVSALFALVFFLMALVVVALYANRHPVFMMRRHADWMRRHQQQHQNAHVHAQSTWLSRSHTRVDSAVHVLVTVLLTMFCSTSSDASSARWILCIAFVAVFFVGAVGHVLYMPYYTYSANVFHTTMWWVLLWAAVCGLVTQAYDNPSLAVGAAMFFGCIPLVAGVANVTCVARRHNLLVKRTGDVKLAHEVELHVRFAIQDAEDALSSNQANQSIEDGDAMDTEHDADPTAGAGVGADAGIDTSVGADAVLQSERALLVGGMDTDAVADECHSWMRHAERTFPRDDVLLVSYARFLHFYANEQHSSQNVLADASGRDPGLDCMFDIMMQRKETELSFRHTVAGKSVLSYMRYVEFLRKAEHHTNKAYRAQCEFWSQMSESHPNQGVLLALGNEVNDNVKKANAMYCEAISINNTSPLVMRRYADFSTYLLNNEEEGKVLSQRARELDRRRKLVLEERKHHASGNASMSSRSHDPILRIFEDDTAVIAISGELESAGKILSSNNKCSAMFGRVHLDLLGSNVSTLMPPPFSDMHDAYIKRFYNTGKGTVIDQTRRIVGLHRNGHLFPLLLTVKEVQGLAQVVFVGVLEEVALRKNEHLMLVNSVNGKVVRASAQCPNALGLTTADLVSGNSTVHAILPGVRLERYVPDENVGDEGEVDKEEEEEEEDQTESDSDRNVLHNHADAAEAAGGSISSRPGTSGSSIGAVGASGAMKRRRRRQRRTEAMRRADSGDDTSSTSSHSSIWEAAPSTSSEKNGSDLDDSDSRTRARQVRRQLQYKRSSVVATMRAHANAIVAAAAAADAAAARDKALQHEHEHVRGENEYDEVQVETRGFRVTFHVYHDELDFAQADVKILRLVEISRERFGGKPGAQYEDDQASVSSTAASTSMGSLSSSVSPLMSPSASAFAHAEPAQRVADGVGRDAEQTNVDKREWRKPLPLVVQQSPLADSADSVVSEGSEHPIRVGEGELEMAMMDEDAIKVRSDDVNVLRDEEDAASARSGMSGGSGMSANSRSSTVLIRAAIERIRSQVLTRHNKMDGAIMGLRIAFFAMVVIIVTMALVGQTVTDTAIADYQDQVDKILKSGARRSHAVTLGYQTRTLDMVRRNVLPRSFIEPTYADMIELASALESDSNDLALRDDKMTKDNRMLYENPVVDIYELVGDTVEVRYVGLLQAITLIISHSKLITETPIEDISTSNEHVYYMIKNTNGIDGIVEFINKSTIYYEKATVDAADVVFGLQLILLCVSVGVMVAMLLLVIRPTIRRVERVRMEVLDMFMEIPTKDIKKLQRSAMSRLDGDIASQMLEMMQEDDESEQDGGGDSSSYLNINLNGPRGSRSQSRRHGGNLHSRAIHSEQVEQGRHEDAGRRPRNHNRLAMRSSGGAQDKADEHGFKHGLRRYTNEQRSFWKLLGKVCVLLVIAGAFFAYVYFVETSALQEAVDRLPELNYAGRRRFFARSSLVEFREAILQPYTANGRVPTVMEEKERLVYENVGFLRAIQQSLMFGNPDYKLQGAIHRLSTRDELMYSDACPYVAHMVPNCRTWNEGIMTHGLDAALEDYLRKIIDGTSVIARMYEGGNWTQDTANSTIRQARQQVLREYDRIYLEKGLQVAATQHSEEERSKLQDMLAFRGMMMGIFLAVALSLYVVVYDPMIRRLDGELKRTRGMLLMIPEALIISTPSLRKLMNKAKF